MAVINAKDIQAYILKHWILKHHCHYACANFSGCGFDECDVLAITGAGIAIEFEVKVSRADYWKDFSKTRKHELYSGRFHAQAEGNLAVLDAYESTRPNKFYYCCPKGMIQAEEVPEYAGLLYFNRFSYSAKPDRVYVNHEIVKKAPMLHKEKVSDRVIHRIARTLSQRFAFGSALMTYINRLEKEGNHYNESEI